MKDDSRERIGRLQAAVRASKWPNGSARDIPEGWYVNLGIGAPVKIADYVPAEREVIFHSENGVLGMGPAPQPDKINRWLINASKHYITLRTGGSYMHHADSFALIRGGHLDLCVLGAFQVAENGDLANWSTSDNDTAPAVGGAMDLAAGARKLWVLMEHTTKSGESRWCAVAPIRSRRSAWSRASTPISRCSTLTTAALSCATWCRA